MPTFDGLYGAGMWIALPLCILLVLGGFALGGAGLVGTLLNAFDTGTQTVAPGTQVTFTKMVTLASGGRHTVDKLVLAAGAWSGVRKPVLMIRVTGAG